MEKNEKQDYEKIVREHKKEIVETCNEFLNGTTLKKALHDLVCECIEFGYVSAMMDNVEDKK